MLNDWNALNTNKKPKPDILKVVESGRIRSFTLILSSANSQAKRGLSSTD